MLAPSILLTDLGGGRETIQLMIDAYQSDAEGNWIQSNTPGQAYPAIVTRSIASPSSENDRYETIISYTVMVYSFSDPTITVNQLFTWLDTHGVSHFLVSQGDAISAAYGAYQFSANEIGSIPTDQV